MDFAGHVSTAAAWAVQQFFWTPGLGAEVGGFRQGTVSAHTAGKNQSLEVAFDGGDPGCPGFVGIAEEAEPSKEATRAACCRFKKKTMAQVMDFFEAVSPAGDKGCSAFTAGALV